MKDDKYSVYSTKKALGYLGGRLHDWVAKIATKNVALAQA